MKTNFLVVGAHRAGTTTLHRCLSQHPQICLADTKSTHFFNTDVLFERGTPSYESYHSQFKPNSEQKVIGESTPDYAYWQSSISRIYRYNPEMKIIMVLRNPIERAYSAWQQAHSQGQEEHDFVSAINLEPNRLRTQGTRGQHDVYSYLDKGFYSRQIEHIYQYFDPHQVLLMRSDNLFDNISVALYQVLEFLGLPYMEVDEAAQSLGDYQRSLPAQVYNELIEIFRRDVYKLEELVGWNCSDWLEPKVVKTIVPKLQLV